MPRPAMMRICVGHGGLFRLLGTRLDYEYQSCRMVTDVNLSGSLQDPESWRLRHFKHFGATAMTDEDENNRVIAQCLGVDRVDDEPAIVIYIGPERAILDLSDPTGLSILTSVKQVLDSLLTLWSKEVRSPSDLDRTAAARVQQFLTDEAAKLGLELPPVPVS